MSVARWQLADASSRPILASHSLFPTKLYDYCRLIRRLAPVRIESTFVLDR